MSLLNSNSLLVDANKLSHKHSSPKHTHTQDAGWSPAAYGRSVAPMRHRLHFLNEHVAHIVSSLWTVVSLHASGCLQRRTGEGILVVVSMHACVERLYVAMTSCSLPSRNMVPCRHIFTSVCAFGIAAVLFFAAEVCPTPESFDSATFYMAHLCGILWCPVISFPLAVISVVAPRAFSAFTVPLRTEKSE